MKRIIAVFSFIFAFIFTQNLMAQHSPHHRGHHAKKGQETLIDMVKKDLDLTESQEEQLQNLKTELKKERRDLHMEMKESGELDREKMRQKMMAQKEAHFQKVMNILDVEQQAILKAKKEEFNKVKEARKADRGENRAEHRAAREKMHKELKAYKDENIVPKLQTQRAKLEAIMSAEDKETIARLRPVFAQQRQKMEQRFEGRKELKERPTPEMREKMKAERMANKEAMKPHFETLKSLVEKYETDIDKLHKEIEGQHLVWEKDMKDIHEKYKPQELKEGTHPRMEHKGVRPHPGNRGERMSREKGEKTAHLDKRKVHFLLMEPSGSQSSLLSQNALTEVAIFPNPATAMNTINYEVKQAGQVRIELKNDAGKTLRVLSDSFKEVGKFTVEVDLAELRDGVYYYTITDGNGVISKKVVVSK